MKKQLLITILLAASFIAAGQFTKYSPVRNFGTQYNRVKVDSVFGIPSDTMEVAPLYSLAFKGDSLYKKTSVKWELAGGPSVTRINDSTFIIGTDTMHTGSGGGFTPPGDASKILVGTGAAQDAATIKNTLGLNLVNNTNDANKPVSTAQAAAIAAKLNITDTSGKWMGDIRISGANVYKRIGGVETFVGTLTATAALDPWYAMPETDTLNFDPRAHGPLQKVILTGNRAIKFSNLKEGDRLSIKFIHSLPNTTITNLIGNTDLPGDFYFASAANWVTQIRGSYDSLAGKWNWLSSVTPDVAISTGGFVLQSSHVMVAFPDFAIPGMFTWLQKEKAAGLNHMWAHVDRYDSVGGSSYRARLKRLMDTAYAVGGIAVSPGMSGPMTAKEMKQEFLDTYQHPAMYKIGGKPVYIIYDFDSTKLVKFVDSLTNNGIPKSSYIVWVNTFQYPQYQYWLPTPVWVNHVGLLEDSASAAQVYNFNPLVDGLVNFSVDKATSVDSIAKQRNINENLWITQASNARPGKSAYAGISMSYHNPLVQDWDLGFRGMDSIAKAQVALARDKRAKVFGLNTNNDMGEISHTGIPFTPEVSGLFYQPALTSHSYVATGFFPSLDHSGVTKFLEPYFTALKNGTPNIIITTNAIFAKYGLHPPGATPSNVIPAALVPYRYADSTMITQTKWNLSPAANAPTWVAAGKRPKYSRIEMAAWLTDSAQLVINGNISPTTFPPGVAFYDIAMPTTGLPITPTFSIRVGGVNIITVSGNQPITTSTWPGQYDFLIQQLYYFKMPNSKRIADEYQPDEVKEYINSLQFN